MAEACAAESSRLLLSLLAVCLAACSASPPDTEVATAEASVAQPGAAECAALTRVMQDRWPDSSTRTLDASWRAAGSPLTVGMPPATVPMAAHCELTATMRERTGRYGQTYAITFHVRLPGDWNGRFLFEGGGGSNGRLGDAIGMTGPGAGPSALDRGFAVVSQDSGHDNAVNIVPERNGRLAFGHDPVARADYGGDSLKPVADAALAVIESHYGRSPDRSYFYGCSKGGQEGMVFAQRHPGMFDGIIANAPGFALPRAGLAEMWDLRQFAAALPGPPGEGISLDRLNASFSSEALELARQAVLDACDGDDGAKDGITAAFDACDTSRVLAAMQETACPAPRESGKCLTQSQIRALANVYAGPRAGDGAVDLYTDWPWDGGLGSPGWRMWKIGSADGRVPSLNFLLGALSMAAVFTTPPVAVADDPEAIGRYVAGFDFDRDAVKIYTTGTGFSRSAWDVISARSPDLRSFRASGGRLIVTHGVSDPVFSINDTLAWYRDVDRISGGDAREFVRVFPIPGMAHCGGGPAVAEFDAFTALVAWVEEGRPPDGLIARGGAQSPWPERTRPVCAYPEFARYRGTGSIEDASSFACAPPQAGR